MTRPIKFRAWDKKNGVMLSWNMICQIAFNRYERPQEPSYTLMWQVLTNFSEIFEVMQFTGLLDKNGKEIYEGDICRYGGPSKGIAEVIWYESGFTLKGDDDGSLLYLPIRPKNCEVIGNIHENPTLTI